MADDSRQLAKLFASKFIARPEVKAFQRANGDWYPDETPITMPDLLAHLSGERSMGHYMLSSKSEVKLFAFDIDLEKAVPEKGIWWPMPTRVDQVAGDWVDFQPDNPRILWESLDAWPSDFDPPINTQCTQDFLIFQMRTCAMLLATSIRELLEIPVAVAYSGHKGLHVYGFTGLVSATEAREAASIILDHAGFELVRGRNFYKKKAEGDPNILSLPQLSIEAFPKQTSLENKGFGNLMRLPLGRNLLAGTSHPHQAKFLDFRPTGRYTELIERNPLEALTVDDPWAGE